MTFEIPTLSQSAVTEQRCINLMVGANEAIEVAIALYKERWRQFWNPTLSAATIQAQLDYLASVNVVDNDIPMMALTAYFAKALRFQAWAIIEKPTAFADGRTDATGQFQEFITPGWVVQVNAQTGQLVALHPCNWVENK